MLNHPKTHQNLAERGTIITTNTKFSLVKDKKSSSEPSDILRPKGENAKEKYNDYSLQNAMNKLAELFKIITEDNREIYLKPSSQVSGSLLKTLALSFTSLSVLFQEFLDRWSNSLSKGPDAIQTSEKLEDRIDIKLYQTEKLDFGQLKKIMVRLNRIDDALMSLDMISFILRYYEDACKEKSLTNYSGLAELFRIYSIDKLRESLRTEANRLGNQIERCNLYYQADIDRKSLKINASALKVAYIALGISALSVLLTTVLAALKII